MTIQREYHQGNCGTRACDGYRVKVGGRWFTFNLFGGSGCTCCQYSMSGSPEGCESSYSWKDWTPEEEDYKGHAARVTREATRLYNNNRFETCPYCGSEQWDVTQNRCHFCNCQ